MNFLLEIISWLITAPPQSRSLNKSLVVSGCSGVSLGHTDSSLSIQPVSPLSWLSGRNVDLWGSEGLCQLRENTSTNQNLTNQTTNQPTSGSRKQQHWSSDHIMWRIIGVLKVHYVAFG